MEVLSKLQLSVVIRDKLKVILLIQEHLFCKTSFLCETEIIQTENSLTDILSQNLCHCDWGKVSSAVTSRVSE